MGKLEEFLLELETELQYLKPKDASEVLKYYRDRINIALDYGETIEHILQNFPLLKKLLAETYKSKGTDFLNIRKSS
ncbi:MAG: HAAS signaling domain-containing protein [Christensenellales bacterium]